VILLSVDRAKIGDRASFLANDLLFLVIPTMLRALTVQYESIVRSIGTTTGSYNSVIAVP
jgi:hypothetical protein